MSEIPNSYNTKRHILERRGSSARVVVLGSSREYFGVVPAKLDGQAINLANVSQTLVYDEQIARKYAWRLPRLALAIQGISYFSFEFQLSDSEEYGRGFFYRRFLGTRGDAGLPLFDPQGFSLVALYGWDRIFEFASKRFAVNLADDVDDAGWYRVGKSVPVDDETCHAHLEFHDSLMKPEHIAENSDALRRMLQMFGNRHVAVALVTVPVHRSYASHLDGGHQARTHAEIARLQALFGIPYFDYTFDPRFDDADFHDCDHLGADGARKFSQILNDEVVRPLMAAGALETTDSGRLPGQ